MPLDPPSRRIQLIAVCVVLGSLGLFALIAEDVLDGGGLISHDQAVLGWFVDHRSEWLITAARWVSTLGGFAGLCVAAVAAGLLLRWRRVLLELASAPLIALLLGALASFVAKAMFGRERPPITLHETTVGLASFPSAHATDAAAFFIALALTIALTLIRRPITRVAVVATGAAGAGIVGLSRLILAVHWLSDVVAGWALGTAIAIAVVMGVWIAATRGRRIPSVSLAEEPRPERSGGFAEP